MREQILALLEKYLPGPIKPAGANNVLTKCPFHKGGEERKPSFTISLEKGLFFCFTCHEAGDIRQLLYKLQLPRSVVDAETKSIQPFLDRERELHQIQKLNTFVNRDPFRADYLLPESILGVYAVCPRKLVDDGFDQSLLQDMGIGYDRTNNRVMYPLRDMYGGLAGFSGGVTELSNPPYPKYKVYQGRRRGLDGSYLSSDFGTMFDERFSDYRCENHDFLWNFDRVFSRLQGVSDPEAMVHVVEGFKACLWMIQCGFKNSVALMGSYMSDRQRQMLQLLGSPVVLFLDNDEAGRKATINVGNRIWQPLHGRLSVVPYPDGDFDTQPDDYETDAVRELINRKKTFIDYLGSRRRGLLW